MSEICFEAPEINTAMGIEIDARVSVVTMAKLIDVSVTAGCKCPDGVSSDSSLVRPQRLKSTEITTDPSRSTYSHESKASDRFPSSKSYGSSDTNTGSSKSYGIDMSKYSSTPSTTTTTPTVEKSVEKPVTTSSSKTYAAPEPEKPAEEKKVADWVSDFFSKPAETKPAAEPTPVVEPTPVKEPEPVKVETTTDDSGNSINSVKPHGIDMNQYFTEKPRKFLEPQPSRQTEPVEEVYYGETAPNSSKITYIKADPTLESVLGRPSEFSFLQRTRSRRGSSDSRFSDIDSLADASKYNDGSVMSSYQDHSPILTHEENLFISGTLTSGWKQENIMGRFTLSHEDQYGRPVYVRTEETNSGKKVYLYHIHNTKKWRIGPDQTSSTCWLFITSKVARPDLIDQDARAKRRNWYEHSGGKWIAIKDMKVSTA